MDTEELIGSAGRSDIAPRKRRRQHAQRQAGGDGDAEPQFLVCDQEKYPQVPAGDYELFCTEAKVYRDPGLDVWKCRYRFINPLVDGFPAIYGFINLGRDNKPPGRRSRYFREWSIANGGVPGKRQRMSARAFPGKIFIVGVDWVQPRQHDGKTHTAETRYSLVKEIKELACSGSAKSPSIEVHKLPSKVGLSQT